MDDIARFNRQRWDALVDAGVAYSRPFLDLTPETARAKVDDCRVMIPVADRDVFCLAGGGGQQSVVFALLEARVTVLDNSPKQLAQDRLALDHYGLDARLEQGDMRDLSRFDDACFDLIYQPFSLNFVPDPTPVFDEVRRLLRPGGQYRTTIHKPLAMDADDWDGRGYPLRTPLQQGQEIVFESPDWDVTHDDGSVVKVAGPREFRHTLSTLLNGLCQRDFVLQAVREKPEGDPEAEPGSWEHYCAVTRPWLTSWWRLGK